MSTDERTVLRAALERSGTSPRLIEFGELVSRSGLDARRVRTAAVALGGQRYCIVTFGGLQLTTGGRAAAGQA